VATLDAPPKGAPDDLTLNDLVGSVDKRFAQVEDELELRPLIAALPVREKRILELYYYDSMTQVAVAGQVGVSQMHVSRLLRRSIGRLRAKLATADG
jgi:RNA polymerase sigma-B factor